MKKKTVIVTGGNNGIGKATAIAFAKKGFNVVISARDENASEKTLREIKAIGAEAIFEKQTFVTKNQLFI